MSLKQKTKFGGLTLQNFTTYYKGYRTQDSTILVKKRQIDQWKGMGNLKIDLQTTVSRSLTKKQKQLN